MIYAKHNPRLREPFHNAQVAGFVLASCNRLDFADCPVYVVASSQLKTVMSLEGIEPAPPYLAFGGFRLSEQIQPFLVSVGAWQSPGCAIVVDDATFRCDYRDRDSTGQFRGGLGLLMHEAGHVVQQHSEHAGGPNCRRIAAERSTRDRLQCAYAVSGVHGAKFIRTTLHLWHRVNASYPIALADLKIAGSRYGLSDVGCYELALRAELLSKTNMPVRDILLTEPPRLLSMLFHDDLTAKAATA